MSSSPSSPSPSSTPSQLPPAHHHQQQQRAKYVTPEPPKDMKPVYSTNDDDEKKICLIKTPACMPYCHKSTTIATIKRDPNGNDGTGPRDVTWQDENVWVYSGRRRQEEERQRRLTLHKNGFELLENDVISRNINFYDKNEVIDKYYSHCEHILSEYLSKKEGKPVTVKAFDHNVRCQNEAVQNTQTPLGLVHADYTKLSGPRRLELLGQPPKINDVLRERLGDQPLLDPNVVQECLNKKGGRRRRFALINVWRNIDKDNPVLSKPLACVDATTHCKDDLRVLQIHYADRIGENYLVCCPSSSSNKQHAWYYFPQMTYDEALLIKQWDSYGGLARGKETDTTTTTSDSSSSEGDDDDGPPPCCTLCIHSAFQDPATPPPLNNNNKAPPPPRQSIEVRCVAIWD